MHIARCTWEHVVMIINIYSYMYLQVSVLLGPLLVAGNRNFESIG